MEFTKEQFLERWEEQTRKNTKHIKVKSLSELNKLVTQRSKEAIAENAIYYILMKVKEQKKVFNDELEMLHWVKPLLNTEEYKNIFIEEDKLLQQELEAYNKIAGKELDVFLVHNITGEPYEYDIKDIGTFPISIAEE